MRWGRAKIETKKKTPCSKVSVERYSGKMKSKVNAEDVVRVDGLAVVGYGILCSARRRKAFFFLQVCFLITFAHHSCLSFPLSLCTILRGSVRYIRFPRPQ